MLMMVITGHKCLLVYKCKEEMHRKRISSFLEIN